MNGFETIYKNVFPNFIYKHRHFTKSKHGGAKFHQRPRIIPIFKQQLWHMNHKQVKRCILSLGDHTNMSDDVQ